MSISRRKFLHAGSLFVVCAGVPLKIFAGESLKAATPKAKSTPVGSATNSLAVLNSEIFSRHLNTNFSLRDDHEESVVRLIEVHHWHRGPGNRPANDGRECFSLVFRGPTNKALRQNTYQVKHDSLGKFDLLVVPTRKGKRGLYYEALFNRLR